MDRDCHRRLGKKAHALSKYELSCPDTLAHSEGFREDYTLFLCDFINNLIAVIMLYKYGLGKQNVVYVMPSTKALLTEENVISYNHWMSGLIWSKQDKAESHFGHASYVSKDSLALHKKMFSTATRRVQNQEHKLAILFTPCCSAGRGKRYFWAFLFVSLSFPFLHLWKDENWRELFYVRTILKSWVWSKKCWAAAKVWHYHCSMLYNQLGLFCFSSSSFPFWQRCCKECLWWMEYKTQGFC